MDYGGLGHGRVLLVGPDEATGELEAILHGGPWLCSRTATPAGVLRRLREASDIDVVVIVAPTSRPEPYLELCRHVKFDARTAFVAVLFALPPGLASYRAEAFTAGADDCIQLPVDPREILLRLSNAYRLKHATDSLEDATAVLSSLANAIEGRDAYTRGHVERVSTYSVEIARRVGVDDEDLPALRIGGIVHDIGKVAVPDQLLNKPGKLTPEEMEIVKRHPIVGYDILQPLRTFRRVLPVVRWHHERPNGTGYPDGLRGEQLPLLPRIVAVADVFDALSTARSYRPALPPEQYRAILARAAECQELDPRIVTVLFEILDAGAVALAASTADGHAFLTNANQHN